MVDLRRLARARERWLADDDPEHFGDAMLLCQAGDGQCGAAGECKLEGFCFRGLASAEVRRGFERRLIKLEHDMHELMVCALPQRLEVIRNQLNEQMTAVQGVVLHFDELAARRYKREPRT